MKLKDLKVGDVIFIRENLKVDKIYGSAYFVKGMKQGVQKITSIDRDEEDFAIASEVDSFNFRYTPDFRYTPEMVDWKKTRRLKLNENCENIKKAIRGDGIFKEITQFGESGNEVTKATTYDGKVIVVKNNNEENDIEKAVMLLMLKKLGFTYGDIKRETEKVKWVPKQGEKYYWINEYIGINWYIWDNDISDRKLLKVNNFFETKEEAEEKLEKIKEVLKGE